MTTPIVVWGTGPNSSKTHVSIAILRLLARRGVRALPFKAISVVPPERWQVGPRYCSIPHHVAAARAAWRPELAPVVVERAAGPGPAHGRLRIDGDPAGDVRLLTSDTLDGSELEPGTRDRVRLAVVKALDTLVATGALLVVEGAGSPVDAADDLACLLTARHLRKRRIVLSTYCWDGGSVAATIGTLDLLPPDLRGSVIGFIQNRAMSVAAAQRWAQIVERRCRIPQLGVVADLAGLPNGDLPTSDDTLADPWADALAAGCDLSWLPQSTGVTR